VNRSAGFSLPADRAPGALAILLCFGVLHGGPRRLFLRSAARGSAPAAVGHGRVSPRVFRLGAKAGMLPLHAWLPEATPRRRRRSPALMSRRHDQDPRYSLVRVNLRPHRHVRWSGASSSSCRARVPRLFGVLYAHDEARPDSACLAYHSVENIGIDPPPAGNGDGVHRLRTRGGRAGADRGALATR